MEHVFNTNSGFLLLSLLLPNLAQDDLFTWNQIYPDLDDPRSVLATLIALMDLGDRDQVTSSPTCDLGDLEIDLDVEHIQSESPEPNRTLQDEPNYPDLVPREEPCRTAAVTSHVTSPLATKTAQPGHHISPELETLFLLGMFLGTIFLLYIFPPEPYFIDANSS